MEEMKRRILPQMNTDSHGWDKDEEAQFGFHHSLS
jgi:hypothetical protein